MKLAITAVTALGLAFAAAAFWRADEAAAFEPVSFEDVRAAVAAAGAVECTYEKWVMRGGVDAPDPVHRRDRIFEGRHVTDGTRRRHDFYQVLIPPGLAGPAEERPKYQVLRSTEVVEPGLGTVVQIDHRRRRATVRLLEEEARSLEEYPALFEFFREPPTEDASPAGEVAVDGETLLSFRVDRFPMLSGNTVTADIFVNPVTRLPVRIVAQRSTYRPKTWPPEASRPGDGERWTYTDFQFGHAVPPEEFRLVIPDGYELEAEWRAGAEVLRAAEAAEAADAAPGKELGTDGD